VLDADEGLDDAGHHPSPNVSVWLCRSGIVLTTAHHRKNTMSPTLIDTKVAPPDRGGTDVEFTRTSEGGVHGSEWMPYSTYGAHRQAPLHRMGSTS
jgi:hypothetical protein